MVNEIQVGSYNALLYKLLSMKEHAPAPSLAPEIVPGFVLENDRSEWAFLKGERLMQAATIPTATVGELTNFTLHNPEGSGVIGIITSLTVGATAGLLIRGQIFFGVPGGTPETRQSRDFRNDNLGQLVPRFQSQAVSIMSAPSMAMRAPAGSTVTIPVDIILPPRTWFALEATVVNFGFDVGIQWRERMLDPAETR